MEKEGQMEGRHEKDNLELKGNIVLSGFKDVDKSSLIILKKIVGNYAKKLAEYSAQFENLTLHLKSLHEIENSKKYQLNAKVVDNGKVYTSEVVERNLFVAVDSALKKVETCMHK